MLFLPKEVDEMLTEGLQEPYLRSKEAYVRPENVNRKLEIAGPENLDLRTERPGLRPKSLDLRPERLDLRPERLDLRPESLDLRPERLDLRPERPD